MAVTDIANSNLTFTGVPVGVQVTRVTDSSADWASVGTDTYFYDKADKLIHYKNASGIVLELFSAGGLTYFTEAQNTTAPNATVNVDSLTAVASTTNADVAIVPKGTGAILAAIPDNTTTGGNKRGANAVDLQTSRGAASQVASGLSSFTAGYGNTASNNMSVSLGRSNTSSGPGGSFSAGDSNVSSATSSVALGASNTSSAFASIAVGAGNSSANNYAVGLGYFNTSSGVSSVCLGNVNTANSDYSFAYGSYAHTFSIIGRQSYASGRESTAGDAQVSKFVLHKRTTDATATTLTTNSSAASTNNQVILRNQSAYRFKGTIIGKESGSSNVAAWDIDGLIVRTTSAATTSLVVGNVNLVSNIPGWGTPTLAADTTNGGLRVQVTGAVTDIQWTSIIETSEVIFDAI